MDSPPWEKSQLWLSHGLSHQRFSALAVMLDRTVKMPFLRLLEPCWCHWQCQGHHWVGSFCLHLQCLDQIQSGPLQQCWVVEEGQQISWLGTCRWGVLVHRFPARSHSRHPCQCRQPVNTWRSQSDHSQLAVEDLRSPLPEHFWNGEKGMVTFSCALWNRSLEPYSCLISGTAILTCRLQLVQWHWPQVGDTLAALPPQVCLQEAPILKDFIHTVLWHAPLTPVFQFYPGTARHMVNVWHNIFGCTLPCDKKDGHTTSVCSVKSSTETIGLSCWISQFFTTLAENKKTTKFAAV